MIENHLLLELEEFIHRSDLNFVASEPERPLVEAPSFELNPDEVEDFVNYTRKPTFSKVLFGFIDSKGAVDSDIYKRAGIDRRHFSKIRSNTEYRPGKHTAIALALALELTPTQTDQLLSTAGYSLSDSDTFDLVIRFFLEREIYDIASINEALDHFNLNTLGKVEA